jgi:cell division protein ZapA (FtsZ GTPase activity inhibitor)
MSELTINLKIANRSYTININRDDEEDIRKAADLINKAILLYKNKYPLKEDGPKEQDYLACAAVHLISKALRFERKIKDAELEDMVKDIDEILKEEC